MKKNHFMKNITDYISDNRLQFFFVVVSLVLGTVIGSLSALSLEPKSYENLSLYLRNFVSSYNIQPISKADIEEVLINLSRTTIEKSLGVLVKKEQIQMIQSGKYAKYYKI